MKGSVATRILGVATTLLVYVGYVTPAVGAFMIDPIADGTIIDTGPPDGVFDTVLTANEQLDVQGGSLFDNIERTALEFDIATIPNSVVVESAILRLFQSVATPSVPIELFGYEGDGTITVADANAGGSLSTLPSMVRFRDIDVTAFIQDLVSNDVDIAGFRIQTTQEAAFNFNQHRFRSSEFTFDVSQRPKLVVTPVPEPTSLAVWLLLGLTVAAACWWRRTTRVVQMT